MKQHLNTFRRPSIMLKICFILCLLFLCSCTSFQQFDDGVTLFLDLLDLILPDHSVQTTIDLEQTDNMMFYIVGNNRYNINTEIRKNFTQRGFHAKTAMDLESVRQAIASDISLTNTDTDIYIVRYSFTTTLDDKYGTSITRMSLQVFDRHGTDMVAEAIYRGQPYLHNSSTRLMMKVFFWDWYEAELAEKAKTSNVKGPKPPRTSNAPLGIFTLFVLIVCIILNINLSIAPCYIILCSLCIFVTKTVLYFLRT